jgi:hypothetical protein
MDWELTGNTHSLESYLMAALSLATRYDERVGAIRSWDKAISKRYSIVDKETNFVIIIDSMCSEFVQYKSSSPNRYLTEFRSGLDVLRGSSYIESKIDRHRDFSRSYNIKNNCSAK